MTTVVVRSERDKYLIENLAAAGTASRLQQENIEKLNALDKNQKIFIWNPEIRSSPYFAYPGQINNRPCRPEEPCEHREPKIQDPGHKPRVKG